MPNTLKVSIASDEQKSKRPFQKSLRISIFPKKHIYVVANAFASTGRRGLLLNRGQTDHTRLSVTAIFKHTRFASTFFPFLEKLPKLPGGIPKDRNAETDIHE
ncbi:MAG: hypothetical protein IMX04_03890 [Candidatus Carbobacillus altaicus]|nr:hypothetical protein [Candidatus Carbobacillus altaicus]